MMLVSAAVVVVGVVWCVGGTSNKSSWVSRCGVCGGRGVVVESLAGSTDR